jgi:hypothetical protein
MGIETAQCKCRLGGPASERARLTSSPATAARRYLRLIRGRVGWTLAGVGVPRGGFPGGVGNVGGEGAGWERADASPKLAPRPPPIGVVMVENLAGGARGPSFTV